MQPGSAKTMTPFGLTLRSIRQEIGLSQSRLASIIQLHPRILSAIETGRRQPPPEEIIRQWGNSVGFSEAEIIRLQTAAEDSSYLIRIPKTASPRALTLAHNVLRALESLRQDQFSAIQQILSREDTS
jgi:HTH-type transcriptional regulator, competence development regulator